MKNKKFESLSVKIVSSIMIASIIIFAITFLSLEKINKKAFYNVELEKATLLLKTIEPIIAVNMYLGLQNKTKEILKQLMKNQDIRSVKIMVNNHIVYKLNSQNDLESLFVLKKNILQPNSQKKIATIVLNYSNQNYKQLLHKYTSLFAIILIILTIGFVLLGIYVEKLLTPLKKIVKLLKDFTPETKIKIDTIDENNEIKLILSALGKMQEKIFDYASKQKDINKYLAKEIDAKTIELRKQLYIDDLTQLPNRKSLFADIAADRSEGALLILNIDDFKEINDFYGQDVGDYILMEFAKNLKNLVSNEEKISVCRLSGDEFSLFFQQNLSKEKLIIMAKKLIAEITNMAFIYGNNKIHIRITIGGTLESQNMLEKADIALKYAKEHDKSLLIYDHNLNIEHQYKENMEWVKKLTNAIENDRIVPYFQPIFNTKTKEVVSYECLIRLIDVDGLVVSPYKFLTIAQKSKLYPKLTEIMIEKSCQHFENKNVSFSVNLSITDILDKEMLAFIKSNVKKYKVHDRIVFEILETEGIENYEEVSSFIVEMKQLGCKISIDDFGSGYSNFEHILKLDVDYIKIDGSLVKNLDTDGNANIVVETIVDFAKRMNLIIIAEFVHNQAVFEKVKALGIERTQGFYLGEPDKDTIN